MSAKTPSRAGHVHGWINLDKPQGMTSTQAVGKIKKIFVIKKAGHAGTLDPLATGVLPIALGEATKTVPYLQDGVKSYSFTIRWGEARDTDDSEGAVIETSDVRPSREAIEAALPAFIGEIEQIPPRFSAIKIAGERAYDLAREGVDFAIQARKVTILGLRLDACDTDTADLTMICGKGTYVRSLARDLALRLGTVGHIAALRRVSVGGMHADTAISFDKLSEMVDNGTALEAVLPITTALDDIPALPLTDREASRLRNGQKLVFSSRPDMERLNGHGINPLTASDMMAVGIIGDNRPLALLSFNGVSARPVRLFNL